MITGAAGGIGSCLVRRFLANGDTVVATDLDGALLETLAQGCDTPTALHIVSGNIADEADCAAIVKTAADFGGRIDILVNCAGYFPMTPFEQITSAEWRRIIEINLTGVFLLVQAAIPLMKAHGWGRIINFGSGTFFKGSPNQAHYISAKAGVIGLSRCLATELGGYGITVNVVTPGLTITEPVKRDFPAELLEKRRNERPLKRDEYPEDLAGTVFFLASPDADFITGQIINVDGGSVKH